MISSLEKFGQYVRQQRLQKGFTQKELAIKVFDSPRYEFIGRLERNKLSGITFATADKILFALSSELDFKTFN